MEDNKEVKELPLSPEDPMAEGIVVPVTPEDAKKE